VLEESWEYVTGNFQMLETVLAQELGSQIGYGFHQVVRYVVLLDLIIVNSCVWGRMAGHWIP
jgi:hypothetical protein